MWPSLLYMILRFHLFLIKITVYNSLHLLFPLCNLLCFVLHVLKRTTINVIWVSPLFIIVKGQITMLFLIHPDSGHDGQLLCMIWFYPKTDRTTGINSLRSWRHQEKINVTLVTLILQGSFLLTGTSVWSPKLFGLIVWYYYLTLWLFGYIHCVMTIGLLIRTHDDMLSPL